MFYRVVSRFEQVRSDLTLIPLIDCLVIPVTLPGKESEPPCPSQRTPRTLLTRRCSHFGRPGEHLLALHKRSVRDRASVASLLVPALLPCPPARRQMRGRCAKKPILN